MGSIELTEKNYLRICFINWALSVPILLIFAWPYFFICEFFMVPKIISLPGSIIFALPFMLTLLHGHVTMAVGAAHREHYYEWLQQYTFTYGLLFHPIIVKTRFRLSLFTLSILLIIVGMLLSISFI
ncbi:hypothetical protein [Rhodohalobacter sp. 8-1]|uniref:hypothetical protein n=1 Tax=Rhodohalobacter sp. 8-1 TaxID=3131972 RepID=UPI0030EBB899